MQSVHRFAQAQRELKNARASKTLQEEVQAVEDELDWNLGNYDRAITAIRSNAQQRPTVQSLATLAMLEHTVGDYDAADRAYEQAESTIRDTNPITVGWLNGPKKVIRAIHPEDKLPDDYELYPSRGDLVSQPHPQARASDFFPYLGEPTAISRRTKVELGALVLWAVAVDTFGKLLA